MGNTRVPHYDAVFRRNSLITCNLQATNDLADRCLSKFDDEAASLDCRAISLYTVIAQITSGNLLMRARIPDIARRLQTFDVLSIVRTTFRAMPLKSGIDDS